MKNFRVIKFEDKRGEICLGVCDYPENLPIPVIGDTVDMKDDDGIYRSGLVFSRTIRVRDEYTEITLIVR